MKKICHTREKKTGLLKDFLGHPTLKLKAPTCDHLEDFLTFIVIR